VPVQALPVEALCVQARSQPLAHPMVDTSTTRILRSAPLRQLSLRDGRRDPCRPRGDIVMFPEPDYTPARSLKAAPGVNIATMVSFDLLTPPVRILLGPGAVNRATMPEAPVHEDSDFRGFENDVGPPTQGGDGIGVDPKA